METIKRFQANIEELSEREKLVLQRLIRACELVAPLYERQMNPAQDGANFYPPDAKKEEIEEAAEKNPLLLHPYTFVERDKWGRLVAVPFCKKFKKELTEITKLLGEAARISDDHNFARYLANLSKALFGNNYGEIEILWVTQEPFKINFIVGPVERYFDRVFFKKCAYQGWVGINDEERTKKMELFKKVILASRRKIFPGTSKIELSRLRIGVDQTIIFAGQKAVFMTLGTNLPNDTSLMEKYGSRLEIFDSSHKLIFTEKHLPIYKVLFGKETQKSFTEEELYLGSFRATPLHEISHSLIRYRDAEERLKELFPVFDELLGDLLGVKSCGILLLKGIISQKELEAILLMQIVRIFYHWLVVQESPARIHYAIGGAMAQKFFLEEKAIKEKKGVLCPDFTKLFIAIDHLARILEYYLASGTYEEAKKFVDEYSSFEVFAKFSSKLKKLK